MLGVAQLRFRVNVRRQARKQSLDGVETYTRYCDILLRLIFEEGLFLPVCKILKVFRDHSPFFLIMSCKSLKHNARTAQLSNFIAFLIAVRHFNI